MHSIYNRWILELFFSNIYPIKKRQINFLVLHLKGINLFVAVRVLSIVFVCTLITGSLKCLLWFTVLWLKLDFLRLLYPPQQSL